MSMDNQSDTFGPVTGGGTAALLLRLGAYYGSAHSGLTVVSHENVANAIPNSEFDPSISMRIAQLISASVASARIPFMFLLDQFTFGHSRPIQFKQRFQYGD